MITITRRTARQLRAVFRRARGTTRGSGPATSLHAGPTGLSACVRQGGVAIEYREPGNFQPQELYVPLQLLCDSEAAKDEPIEIESGGEAGGVATWNDGGISQIAMWRS